MQKSAFGHGLPVATRKVVTSTTVTSTRPVTIATQSTATTTAMGVAKHLGELAVELDKLVKSLKKGAVLAGGLDPVGAGVALDVAREEVAREGGIAAHLREPLFRIIDCVGMGHVAG